MQQNAMPDTALETVAVIVDTANDIGRTLTDVQAFGKKPLAVKPKCNEIQKLVIATLR